MKKNFSSTKNYIASYQLVEAVNAGVTLEKPLLVKGEPGTGKTELVLPMAKAAIAAGADGLMIEMHPNPIEAFSDGPQSLNPIEFEELMKEIVPFVNISGKSFS